MKRILLISAASVAFASVAAAQDAAVSLMPEVSGSATAGNTVGSSFTDSGKTVLTGAGDVGSAEYFDFDIDIAYTWGDFTATFNLDGGKGLTSNFYNDGDDGIEFQLTYSDGDWDYTVGSNGGDTFIEADGSTGTFGYSNDIPSVFDTDFASAVEIDGYLESEAFPMHDDDDTDATSILNEGTSTTVGTLTNELNPGSSAVLAPDYAVLIAGTSTGLQVIDNNADTLVYPDAKKVDYSVSDGTDRGLYFIAPSDDYGIVVTTANGIDSKTGNADDPTLSFGGFLETDFVTAVGRVTPTETTVNLSGEYELNGITIEGQLASHSYDNLRSGVNTVAFSRTGGSVALIFDAGNATHTLTVEDHADFEVNVGGLSRNLTQGGSQFISYDGDFGDYSIHVNQGTREATDVDASATSLTAKKPDSSYAGGSQSGLVFEYNLSDDVSIGLGYNTLSVTTDGDGATAGVNGTKKRTRTFLDAGIKISF